MTTATTSAERTVFEEEMSAYYDFGRSPDGDYESPSARAAWKSWLVGRTAMQAAEPSDTQRLDYLEAWRLHSIAQGFMGDTYQFITDIPVREQLDREIAASSAAKGASDAANP